ncbi:MAG: hypothetical protein HY606_07260 [Planctomycetes bacterium]|nr:hypothetical protein [Planctomycetota bacterium]
MNKKTALVTVIIALLLIIIAALLNKQNNKHSNNLIQNDDNSTLNTANQPITDPLIKPDKKVMTNQLPAEQQIEKKVVIKGTVQDMIGRPISTAFVRIAIIDFNNKPRLVKAASNSVGTTELIDKYTDTNGEFFDELTYNSLPSENNTLIVGLVNSQNLDRKISPQRPVVYDTTLCYSQTQRINLINVTESVSLTIKCDPTAKLTIQVSPNDGVSFVQILVKLPEIFCQQLMYNDSLNFTGTIHGTTFEVPANAKLILICQRSDFEDASFEIDELAPNQHKTIMATMNKLTISFKGKCIDEDGNSLEGVTIYAHQDGKSDSYATTNKFGEYSFKITDKPLKKISFQYPYLPPYQIENVNQNSFLTTTLKTSEKKKFVCSKCNSHRSKCRCVNCDECINKD